MALPSPNLDDRRFQQFVDDAKRYIQQRAPEWTDHNVSDPGVTLVETVAHMADQIVYRLNRVPEKNHLAFLDLVGITLFPPSAARTDVTFWLSAPQEEPVLLPWAPRWRRCAPRARRRSSSPPSANSPSCPASCGISSCSTGASPSPTGPRPRRGQGRHVLRRVARPGDCMLFGLSAAVPHCALALELDSRVDGVGVDPRQPPLVWEAWTEDGWQACEVDRDGTGGLNRPGAVVLHIPGGHTLSRNGGQEAGWLRCRVTEPLPDQPFYTTSPTVRSAEAFTIGGTTTAVHADTCTTRRSASPPACPGSGCGSGPRPGRRRRPPLLLQTAEHDGWTDWQVVPHFAASGPDDRHITLDAATGDIAFGPPSANPTAPCASTAWSPPRAR
jgi:hypothetical protein